MIGLRCRPTFSRFDTNHACDSDRQTDGRIGVAYTRYSIYAVARKYTIRVFFIRKLENFEMELQHRPTRRCPVCGICNGEIVIW